MIQHDSNIKIAGIQVSCTHGELKKAVISAMEVSRCYGVPVTLEYNGKEVTIQSPSTVRENVEALCRKLGNMEYFELIMNR